jgi:hypothetical protein
MLPNAIDPAIAWVGRLCLGLLFLSAGYYKLREPAVFRRALVGYALLPERRVPLVAALLPIAELAVAVGLTLPGLLRIELASQLTRGAALGAMALLGLYTVAMIVNLTRGRSGMDCGCGRAHRPVGPGLLARNGFLAAATALCILPAGGRPLGWLDVVVVTACVVSSALIYVALEIAAANAAHQKQFFVSRIAPAAIREGA